MAALLNGNICDAHYAEMMSEIEDMQTYYGYFPGGDPRDFTPDQEVCTPEEIARWEAACKRWEAGDTSELPPEEHGPWIEQGGKTVGLCHAYRSFGMGTYRA